MGTHIQQGCRQSPHPRTHVTTKMARATGGQIRKKKGEAGAAKNYITRTQAIKKLQCSMADFRRLCILKGIFPRQPKSTKKANKGSTAPASFYYIKDIQYLLHEPVLQKLRQYKTFSKKLSKAVGRGEWTTAKSLEENQKPKYRLDHIIKERSEMKWKAKKRAMRRRKRRRRNLPALETILKQSRPKSWMLTPAISPVQRCWQLPPTPTTRPCSTLLSSRQRARACLTVNFKPSSPPSQRRPRRPQQLPTKRAQQRRRQMHCRHPPPRSRIQHPSCYPTSSASCTIR